jgi:hypothetical protein
MLRVWSTTSTDTVSTNRNEPRPTFKGRPVVQLGPIEETDDAYSLIAVLDAGEDHVTAAIVSWAKTPFDTWWREESPSVSPSLATPAVAYVLATPRAASCVNDSWAGTVPTARAGHTAIWTGSEMIIWGGGYNTGGRYDPSTDTWRPTSVGANVPSARSGHTAIWTGEEMVIWGGQSGTSTYFNTGARYVVSTGTWTPTSTAGSVPTARAGHTAVWTGNEMIVWGGTGASGTLKTGGRYKPTTNGVWRATSTSGNVPYQRTSHTAVWTGTEMIIWGGVNGSLYLDSGERYNPVTNTWTDMSEGANLPSARASHTAVWAGKYMIIWGGYDGGYLYSGAVYYPAEDKWWRTSTVAGAPSGRSAHTAVWTGTRMIVWGGTAGWSVRYNDGGVYDPAADAWSPVGSSAAPISERRNHTAVWTGTEMIVWGGLGSVYDPSYPGSYKSENTGARYNPGSNTWVPMPPDGPSDRDRHTAVWTGSEMIVWGGESNPFTHIPFNTGGRYDPSTDTWRETSVEAETPSPRFYHTAVWTGSKMMVWGGCLSTYCGATASTGGLYDPMTDHWSATSTIGAPSARSSQAAVWTGSSVIVWGGQINGSSLPVGTGGRYDPSADSWAPTIVEGAPQARYNHTMIWTGSRAIVWGGQGYDGSSMVYYDGGGLYDPSTDSWSPTGTGSGHPSGRARHTAVWTGNEMIVWGGTCGSGCSAVGNTGGCYAPSTDSWTPTSTGTNVPSPKASLTAIWTGNEMIVWSGTGGLYNPAADFWQPMSTVEVLIYRWGSTAVATGSQMVVWGGGNGVSGWTYNDGGNYCYACQATTWYRDADGDGYGDPAVNASSCAQPPGWVATAGDCNDACASCHPGGIEICDGYDNDCDGTVDNGGSALCNDGNGCTIDACTAGGCMFAPVLVPEVNNSVAVAKPQTDTMRRGGEPRSMKTGSRAPVSSTDAVITWTDAPGPFNVYRGSRTGLAWAYNEACFKSGTASPATDEDLPAPGVVAYYLVSRTAACGESTLGHDSTGTPIPNLHPCP